MGFKLVFKLCVIISVCFSQVSIESTPKSFNFEEQVVIPTKKLPAFDIQSFMLEDENEMRSIDTKPYRFAKTIKNIIM